MTGDLTVLVSMHDSRLSTAASRRMASLHAELARRGAPVVELCPAAGLPRRPGTRSGPRRLARLLANDRPVPVRLLGELVHATWTTAQLLRLRPARLFVTIPHVPAAIPALVARWWGCHVVLELRDLTWEYAVGAQPSRARRAASRAFHHLVARAAARSAHVVYTTGSQAAAVHRAAPSADVHVVRNGVSEELRHRLGALPALDACPDRPQIVYAGTLGHAQDPAQLLRLAELWPEAQLVLVGDGPARPALGATAAHQPNVTLHSPMAFDDLVETYASASILIACLRRDPSFASAVPSKLYEYAATGRVVAFVGPGEGRDVTEALGGVAADRVDGAFVAALRRALDVPGPHGADVPSREAGAHRIAELLLEDR